MSLRYEILKACAANPGAPMTELCDAIEHDRQKTTWSVRDCAKAGLLSMRLDDVTGQPGYTLTAEGKQRLAEGPASKHGSNMKKAGSDSEGGETDVKAQSAEIPPQITPEIPPTPDEPDDVEHDDALPPADASLLALANRELADRLARVAHVLRGSGLEALKGLDAGADLQPAVAALTGAYQMALADLQYRTDSLSLACAALGNIGERLGTDPDDGGPGPILDAIDKMDEDLRNACALGTKLQHLLDSKTHECEALRREIQRSGTPLAGYLVRASKRKPRTLLDKDKARDAALSSIRAGAQRAEVFALVPVGHARRGVEWRSA